MMVDASIFRMRGWAMAMLSAWVGLAAAAGGAAAHPHQFVDAKVVLLTDAAGRLKAIEASFAMDETESLYIASEFGLDPDGPLTDAQSVEVGQAYAEGYEQFNWFTHPRRGEDALALTAPADARASMSDGVLTIRWTLPLATPAPLNDPVIVQFYDPTFFAEVSVREARLSDAASVDGCGLEKTPWIPGPGDAELLAVLALIPPTSAPEDPTIGRRFADRLEARCGPGQA